ncbi:Cellular retinaldehyde binding/alpha-tocopherol transport [Trema orientale]|uniref:Cellular retinaldehyde binding/alpha-tocopherol transport n=1 Tax=Trema orientale TaxID=63057 RepID=A0A2P5ENV5_TREOI|nr:Cellular retinaldehyde binding/alpha-tocopherol transport [Trema orientale]
MTVEVKAEETQMAEVLASEEEAAKKVEKEADETDSKPRVVEKSSSYKEESNFLSDLKEFEKKALIDLKAKLEEAILGNSLYKKEEPKKNQKASEGSAEEKEKPVEEEEGKEEKDTEKSAEESKPEGEENEKGGEKEENTNAGVEERSEEIDRDISLWGVPLLPSKGAEGTDVVLLKFLRAREFKVNEAFEMLKKTLQWRKDSKIDSVLDEELCVDLRSAAYVYGVDREGHPVCYNVFGVFESEELYQKTFGTEEKRSHFLRWRCQLMEKSIQKLDMKPSGVSSLLHVNDLKNSPGPSKKELRIATKQAVGLLQDNYPELVAKNIFINVPFWYYALNALLSPFLTQRTKSKIVIARPAKVTETLLKYIPAEEIPVQYGGFKRENDFEFYGDDSSVSELVLKPGVAETIEIPAAEVDSTLIWDLTVLGWEVNYKEEFVPSDEGSYTIIVQKGKKMGSQEGPLRNTYRSNEPGKVVLTIENTSNKKKRVLYRYKTKKSAASF